MKSVPLLFVAALITLPAGTSYAHAPAHTPSHVQNPATAAPAASPADTAQAAQTSDAPAGAAQAGAGAQAAAAVPATAADLKVNADVYDQAGGKVGTIESVTSSGAVVSTGAARAQIPVASFTKTGQGLALSVTKTQLEAAVANAATSKQ